MSSRCRLLHTFTVQLGHLVPGTRITRTRPLALLVLGILWAGTVSLPRIAAHLPLSVSVPSTERRLRRWLANPAVHVVPLWRQLLPALLAGRRGQALTMVFDPTPIGQHATVLTLGLVVRHRVLPLAWRIVPQQSRRWPKRQATYVRLLVDEVAAALPAGCTATLLADRGVTSAGVIDACRRVGWQFVLRLNARPVHGLRLRHAGQTRPLWDLVTGPGQHWTGRVAVFRQAGWRRVWLTIHWATAAPSPWVLLTDTADPTAVRRYRRRMRIEATFQDCKRRGFDLGRTKLRDPARLDRLVLALHLACWWGQQLGLRVLRRGQRAAYDRADRRDLSLLRLGRHWFHAQLARDAVPPLPFRQVHGSWRYTWLD